MKTSRNRNAIPMLPGGIALLLILAILGPSASIASGGDELVSLARNGKRVLIADFGLGWCSQCKAQSEILDKVKAAYPGKVLVRMVRVDREKALTARYEVETIPHLVFFDPEGNVVLRKTGVMRYEDISAQLTRMGVTP